MMGIGFFIGIHLFWPLFESMCRIHVLAPCNLCVFKVLAVWALVKGFGHVLTGLLCFRFRILMTLGLLWFGGGTSGFQV